MIFYLKTLVITAFIEHKEGEWWLSNSATSNLMISHLFSFRLFSWF